MNRPFLKFCGPQIVETAFTSLCGLLEGIKADMSVNTTEVAHLKSWFESNIKLKSRKPFDEIFNKFAEIIADDEINFEEIQDLKWVCEKFKHNGSFYNDVTKDTQHLHGLVAGISADGVINEKELTALKNWLYEKEYLKGTWPYDDFYSLCTSVLADGKIDKQEKENIIHFFKDFLNFNGNKSLSKQPSKPSTVKGICAIDPHVEFDYKRFVITGASSKAPRSKIKEHIEDWAGTVDDRITHKTDYLVVMAEGNSAWAYTAYGRKVEQAMQLRKQGFKIIIIHENDFWDAILDMEAA